MPERLNESKDVCGERPFLRVSVFARDHARREHQSGVQNDESVSRQWTGNAPAQFVDATLGGGEVISIDDLDAATREKGWQLSVHGKNDRRQSLRSVTHQRSAEPWPQPIELVVDRRDARGSPDRAVPGAFCARPYTFTTSPPAFRRTTSEPESPA